MASNVLPQGLCLISKNNRPCSGSNLGFSKFVSRRSAALNSVEISSLRVSLNRFSLSSESHNGNSRSGSIVVRAETGEEAEAGEEGEAIEAADGEAAEAPETGTDAKVEEKPPRKPRVKLGNIMGILNKRAVEASERERPIPDIRTGDVVEIKLEVPENKLRLTVYKGIVISKQNAGIHTTIRIRRIIAGVGVEIVFPVYSPNIKEIRVLSHRKVRRARLYYLRDKLPKLSTFK